VLLVAEGRGADTIEAFADDLAAHGGTPEAIESVSIDMSPAFIKGVTMHLPNARITFDKFHVLAHASLALDKTRRIEQKTDPSLKGLRWTLLKDRSKLGVSAQADLDALVAQFTTKRTARAWLYREQLRDILDRKQVNVLRGMLSQWCTNVMRSKVEPMKEVARLIRNHMKGIVAWAREAPDQWLPRSLERPHPGRQTQSPWLPPILDHPHGDLPHRRQARLLSVRPACRLTHSKFKRAYLCKDR
jgi:transposase